MSNASTSLAMTMTSLLLAAGVASVGGDGRADGPSDWVFAPGVQATLSFGGGQVRVGFGVDVRMTYLFEGYDPGCSDVRRDGVGAFGNITFYGDGQRFAVGLHGGGEVEDQFASFDGEIGWTWRSASPEWSSGHGLHLGLLVGLVPASEVTFRSGIHPGERPMLDGHVGLGFRVGSFGPLVSFCSEGD